MRRTPTLALAALASTTFVLVGFAATGSSTPGKSETTPEPRLVNIVAACTSPSPRVSPSSVTVNAVDEVQWRDPSGQAVSFTVEPKVPGQWPFTASAHEAERGEAAATGPPGSTTLDGRPVQQGQVFRYRLSIVCPGGTPRVIEADIVMGEM